MGVSERLPEALRPPTAALPRQDIGTVLWTRDPNINSGWSVAKFGIVTSRCERCRADCYSILNLENRAN